jgi:hypothetical protein
MRGSIYRGPTASGRIQHSLPETSSSNGGLRRRRGEQRFRPAFSTPMRGEAAVHGGLPGVAGLPRTQRLAPERGRHPNFAAASGRRRRTTRRTRQRSAAHQARGLQRRRLVPTDAAMPRRPWTGVQPLGPRLEQLAGAATAGRRRLHR